MPENKIHGLCFSMGDRPIMRRTLAAGMRKVAPFCSWIRTYDCSVKSQNYCKVAHELGLKVATGAWLDGDTIKNDRELNLLIEAARNGLVDLAVIGNETLWRNELSGAELADYIRRFKRAVSHVPATTGDVGIRLIKHPEVVEVVDIIGMHHYPYWSGIGIDDAMSDFDRRYRDMTAHAQGKDVLILETGWPSGGNTVGSAVPTPENAKRYFREIMTWAEAESVKVFYFEAYDEKWKAQWEGPQGAHWGIWRSNKTRKFWL